MTDLHARGVITAPDRIIQGGQLDLVAVALEAEVGGVEGR
jgi:hypothetical protein